MLIEKMFSVSGKYVLITGSTRGIGLAVAKGFIANGSKVIIHGRNEKVVKEKAESLRAFSYVYGSFAEESGTQNVINQLLEKNIPIDVLINNAGAEIHSSIENTSSDILERIYRINTQSHYLLTSKLIPILKRSEYPSIINVTSIHDVVPVRNNSPYCMAKAALGMFTKISALEFGKFGIRVNNKAPGAIQTEMNKDLLDDLKNNKGLNFNDWIPLCRVGDASEMVGPCIFLASRASSYMTGATLYVDGGYKENLLRY